MITTYFLIFSVIVNIYYIYYSIIKRNLCTRLINCIFKFIKNNDYILNYIPYGSKIKKDLVELENAKKDVKKNCLNKRDLKNVFANLPVAPTPIENILIETSKIKTNSLKDLYKISGAVYINNESHIELMKTVNNQTLYTNPLHDLWPQLKKQKAEIISMIKHKFHGDDSTCGTMTSGGTTSILAAIYAYKKYYNYQNPNIVMSKDAHPAYSKACDYFDVIPIIVPVNYHTRVLNPKNVKRYITSNTICIITSAPSYPFGIVDNIPEIAKIAESHGCGCHVDACLGGGLIPWASEFCDIYKCDFRVSGVTSISIDTHKYFYAPKESSVILFKNKELRNHLTFVKMDWPGGFYVTPSFVGSSSGTHIAETWASLLYLGDDGFREMTKKIISLRKELVNEIVKIPEISVLGNPQLSVVGIVSDIVDMHSVYDILTQRGWYFNALQNPTAIHFCITATQTQACDFIDRFVDDMKYAINKVKQNNLSSKTMKMYCSTGDIPNILFSSLTREIGEHFQYCDEQFVDIHQVI